MESTIYTVAGREFELKHYGVKGMKWGVRKTRKWATSKYQPSSARSSALAGLYAATGNERIGRALDKSNDRDAANWERAKQDYKRLKAAEKAKKSNSKKSRLERAADAVQRDADDLRKHGYEAEADAVQKVADKYRQKAAEKKLTKERAAKTAAKGAEATAKVLSKVGQAYITDQIFWGGMGTKIAKETVKAMGRATITAYTMARGGYDIKWYDKQGRRVG